MSARQLTLTSAADVQARPVRWLWPGYIPMGKITVLAGAPGLGKSLLAIRLAAQVSNAAEALIASAEDDPEDTVKPRLMAAEATFARVHLMDVRQVDDLAVRAPGIVQLPGDAAQIHQAVNELGAKLVVLDPVAAFLDAAHSAYREQEVRAALAPLKYMAEQTGCAVVVVMHLNKGEGSDPLRRIANSGAFTALARSVLLFGPDPENEDGDRGDGRILVVAKGNNRQRGTGGLRMRITTRRLEVAGEEIDAAALEVIGPSSVRAEDLLGEPDERSAKGAAMTWLRELLAAGPVAATEVYEAAEKEGIAKRTLNRAKHALRIGSVKDGTRGAWDWRLPSEDDDAAALATDGALGNLPMATAAPHGNLGEGVGNLAKDAQGASPSCVPTAGRTALDRYGSADNLIDALVLAFDADELVSAGGDPARTQRARSDTRRPA